MSGDEESYELVVPFVACVSQGGIYDDTSFAAGFDLGQLDRTMRDKIATTIAATVRAPSYRQLDLLAMRQGWLLTMLCGPGVDPAYEEWINVELTYDPSHD